MAPSTGRKLQIFQEIVFAAATQISAYFLIRYIISTFTSDGKGEETELQQKSAAALRRIEEKRSTGAAAAAAAKRLQQGDDNGSPASDGSASRGSPRSSSPSPARTTDFRLTQYEALIAQDVVSPDDIAVSFADIGGLDSIIDELQESVIYPLTLPDLYSRTSSLLAAPSGVLLYGPPGCGKTMLAKALAHESGASFINLHISTLTEKWYGDSNKLVNAVFSLARKLQPAIVFIDEIDAVLGTRRSGEHEASGMVKAEFMTHWDGLLSANPANEPQRILILGATNRIQDIDDAILRRMPKRFPVSLPSAKHRKHILRLILRDTKLDPDPTRFDLDSIVRYTAGMSGSDLKEVCREAAMWPVREFIRERNGNGNGNAGGGQRERDGGRREEKEIRGLRTEDFFRQQGGKRDGEVDGIEESESENESRVEI
ncbi:MAG: hypothetical protein M1816_000045 [Peltula sp. TS41687]|nr:MAG: hypothetical protein M1816_000045 [Peltula sp. TS41687]